MLNFFSQLFNGAFAIFHFLVSILLFLSALFILLMAITWPIITADNEPELLVTLWFFGFFVFGAVTGFNLLYFLYRLRNEDRELYNTATNNEYFLVLTSSIPCIRRTFEWLKTISYKRTDNPLPSSFAIHAKVTRYLLFTHFGVVTLLCLFTYLQKV